MARRGPGGGAAVGAERDPGAFGPIAFLLPRRATWSRTRFSLVHRAFGVLVCLFRSFSPCMYLDESCRMVGRAVEGTAFLDPSPDPETAIRPLTPDPPPAPRPLAPATAGRSRVRGRGVAGDDAYPGGGLRSPKCRTGRGARVDSSRRAVAVSQPGTCASRVFGGQGMSRQAPRFSTVTRARVGPSNTWTRPRAERRGAVRPRFAMARLNCACVVRGAGHTAPQPHHPTRYATRPITSRSAVSVSARARALGMRSRSVKRRAVSCRKSTGKGVTRRPAPWPRWVRRVRRRLFMGRLCPDWLLSRSGSPHQPVPNYYRRLRAASRRPCARDRIRRGTGRAC